MLRCGLCVAIPGSQPHVRIYHLIVNVLLHFLAAVLEHMEQSIEQSVIRNPKFLEADARQHGVRRKRKGAKDQDERDAPVRVASARRT